MGLSAGLHYDLARKLGITDNLSRFNIGLEDANDLIREHESSFRLSVSEN